MIPVASDQSTLVDLVITGPEALTAELAYKTGSRTTLGVITQLLAQSRKRVIVSVPYMQPGYGLIAGPMHDALLSALARGVRVDVVSNSRSLQLLRDACTQSPRGLTFFRPRANIENQRRLGSHAKICIADGQAAYIGSANFTGPGLSDQIEMGLLVRGDAALRLENFCLYCIESGLFLQLTQ
jgi:phosphatidylserine/phosphatidylglycerophosphate/cardiolipin synthase-like enzyme